MEKIMALAAGDEEFACRLSEYLNGQADFGFRTVVFTEERRLAEYAEKNSIEILLCDEQLLAGGLSERFRARRLMVLSEYSFVNEQSEYPVIFKYQSAKNIMKDILSFCRQGGGEGQKPGGERRALLSVVCSPAGGCYKSTFALALALHRSKQRRTLLISFDPFFTLPSQKKDFTEQSLTDVIYFMEENEKQLDKKVGNVVRRLDGLDYITGVAHWYDLYDFSVGRMRMFLDTVLEEMGYECVILDYGSFDITGMEILLRCDRIYVPGTGRGREQDKYEEWLRQIKFVSGAEVLEKLKRLAMPFDAELDRADFTIESLHRGVFGDFVEEVCCREEI